MAFVGNVVTPRRGCSGRDLKKRRTLPYQDQKFQTEEIAVVETLSQAHGQPVGGTTGRPAWLERLRAGIDQVGPDRLQ